MTKSDKQYRPISVELFHELTALRNSYSQTASNGDLVDNILSEFRWAEIKGSVLLSPSSPELKLTALDKQ